MTKAQAEQNMAQGDIDLAACEAKRRLLLMAWPLSVSEPE